jgi:serine/threonine-protein kinase
MRAPDVVAIGTVLDGKYRVERHLAEGGMGIVLLATHLQLDRLVAIKFLRASARLDASIFERFQHEAKLAAQIRSEHVVRVHDVGLMHDLGPYMVMEYLEGDTLASLLTNGALPVGEAVDYVLQACNALAEVHALGIVHRDLKPENLFLAQRRPHPPIVKLIDFGISKLAPRRGNTGEWTGEALGTPAYMSPEQLEGDRVDERADIWGLGVVLYELLTNRKPFDEPTLPDLCTAIVSAAPVRPSAIRPDVPPEVERALLRCLEKSPANRVRSVLELATALAPFGRATPDERLQGVALASRPLQHITRSAPTVVVDRGRSSRSILPLLAGFGVLAVLGIGLILYAITSRKPAPSPPVAAVASVVVPVTTVTAPPTAPSDSVSLELPSPPLIVDPVDSAPTTKRPKRPAPARDPRASFGERK